MTSTTIYKTPLCSCVICREVKSSGGIHSHYLALHGTAKERDHQVGKTNKRIPNHTKQKDEAKQNRELYYNNPNKCKQCSVNLRYDAKNSTFCSRSCSASFNNAERIKTGYIVTDAHKKLTSDSVRASYEHRGYPKFETVKTTKNMFSKVLIGNCPHCLTKFCCKRRTKYCRDCGPLYDSTYRDRFKFTFNVYYYPDLFDIRMIKEIGWYSRGGTAGKWNPNGMTRDHKISVTDAIRNNYSPFYITHPLNCEIMSWTENNKKKGKSSMSYDDLRLIVDEFERNKAD